MKTSNGLETFSYVRSMSQQPKTACLLPQSSSAGSLKPGKERETYDLRVREQASIGLNNPAVIILLAALILLMAFAIAKAENRNFIITGTLSRTMNTDYVYRYSMGNAFQFVTNDAIIHGRLEALADKKVTIYIEVAK